MIVLSYLGLLALIPLIMKKDDPEIQWHAKNGLVITAAIFIFFIVIWIPIKFVPGFGCIAAPFMCVAPLLILGLDIFLIMKALKGERPKIPGVSDFADKF